MLKTLVALAAGIAVLSATGCCWPLRERHYRYDYDRSSEARRPAPDRGYGDRGDYRR